MTGCVHKALAGDASSSLRTASLINYIQETNPNDVQWGTLSGSEKGEATQTIFNKIIDFFSSFIKMIIDVIKGIVAAARG